MSACTFFGHRDTPQEIESILKEILIDLIENKNVDLFYVGNQGKFDNMVRKNLKLLKCDYLYINYMVVLAYMPGKNKENLQEDFLDTVYPDVLETTPLQYAISKRNKWMIDNSDYVITYVEHSVGGAAKFKKIAEKKGKIVINLAFLKST
ncbi:MAG: hypothetical protein ACI4GY_07995 [Acutalibacteraceae bacterium]